MPHKHDDMINFIPTPEHYDACDKMSMAWSNFVHKLLPPDEFGNTYTTDVMTYRYLMIIINRATHPHLGTARMVDMDDKKRAVLDHVRDVHEKRAPAPFVRNAVQTIYVHPKQYGLADHDERAIERMWCVSCGMDFFDHHDISTRAPIHCPFCESGHVSMSDPLEYIDVIIAERHAAGFYDDMYAETARKQNERDDA